MELNVIETTLISLVGTVASLAVGFGAFSSTTEQLVVSTAGTLISLGFSLYSEIRARTKVNAAIAMNDPGYLRRTADRL